MSGRKTIYGDEHLDARLEVKLTRSQKQEMERKHKQGGPDLNKQVRSALEFYANYRETYLIGTIPAGYPGECETDFTRPIICTEHPSGYGYGYLEVQGDSMNRRVPDGALALIQRNTPYRSGQVVAVCLNWPDRSEFTLKVFVDAGNDIVELQPDSTNRTYLPIILSQQPPVTRRKVQWLSPERATVEGVYTGDYIYRQRK